MHTMWKGSIQFGMVHIPVKMYAATEKQSIPFRYLHKECQTPVKNVRYCPHCEKDVSWEEIIKGVEYEEGKFVLMDQEDLKALQPDNSKAIKILDFVQLEEIDPIYFDRTYFLGPADTGEHAYALLRSALEQTGKIGVAQITIRSKQSLAVVRVYEGCLVMETIFYPAEVRHVTHVPGVPASDTELPAKELKMAQQLIENLSTSFTPENYTDTYRQALQEAIEQKVAGKEVVEAKGNEPEKVVDLMEALKQSLEKTKTGKEKSKKKA
ncbi:Ku protein [Mechercharimyces sp. CAU 1602]|uniref:non-homologous end joining protein Ku n=1 Tax=Mechercharimyces sp. CAU 1602 TaxID=2973933 RepID=UPI002162A7E2|nr:Ku protein [Mechercharimyces sp. CAU 1602]MCS1351018.1 Ku protein [Mechercharimyces sp. CAU 1602]